MIRPRHSQADQTAKVSLALVETLVKQALRNQREWAYPGNPLGQGSQGAGIAPMMPLIKAVVTDTITAATQNGNTITAGSGTVQLWYMSSVNAPDTLLIVADPDSSGANNTAPRVPCLNWYQNTGNVNTATSVWVTPVDNAVWLIAGDCPGN